MRRHRMRCQRQGHKRHKFHHPPPMDRTDAKEELMLCIHVLCSSRGVPFLRLLLVWLLLVNVPESSPFAIGFSLRSIPIRTGGIRSTDRPAHNYNNNAPLSRGGGGWNNNNNWHTRPPSHSYFGRLVQLDSTNFTTLIRP
eukprot:scaffold324813_cov51-Attheya_sp.AAC.1